MKVFVWIKYNEMRKLIGFYNIDKRDFKIIQFLLKGFGQVVEYLIKEGI